MNNVVKLPSVDGPTPRQLVESMLADWDNMGEPDKLVVVEVFYKRDLSQQVIHESTDIEVIAANCNLLETQGILVMAQHELERE